MVWGVNQQENGRPHEGEKTVKRENKRRQTVEQLFAQRRNVTTSEKGKAAKYFYVATRGKTGLFSAHCKHRGHGGDRGGRSWSSKWKSLKTKAGTKLKNYRKPLAYTLHWC